ncbi:hypothetical protein [Calothrix sp. NIES-2098]|uniref:hypothetical protein n=1 Tax=Calothrix sp. NIES-2098 TaxID=1954171 RepID=UPI000B5FD81B|nr:hypothetical protein NIES2098_06360 [Calothrix sp. NIES-2098]
MERFIGFYTSLPFWAGAKVDIDSFCKYINSSQREEIEQYISSLLSKEEFVYYHDGYTLKICKDGMILLRIPAISNQIDSIYAEVDRNSLSSSENYIRFIKEVFVEWSKYIHYLNCIYLLLDSCLLKTGIKYFEISEISSKDIFGIAFDNGEELGMKISPSAIVFQAVRRFPLLCNCTNIFFRFQRKELPESVFNLLNSNFSTVYSNQKIVKVLAEVTKSLSEYKIANYPTSLVLSWFIIESFVSNLCSNFLESKNQNVTYINDEGIEINCKRINSERKAFLIGRDYTISTILNILEISGLIEFNTFKKIDKIRQMRNKIVHADPKSPNNYDEKLRKNCQDAFEIITHFIEKEVGIVLAINLDSPVNDLWVP